MNNRTNISNEGSNQSVRLVLHWCHRPNYSLWSKFWGFYINWAGKVHQNLYLWNNFCLLLPFNFLIFIIKSQFRSLKMISGLWESPQTLEWLTVIYIGFLFMVPACSFNTFCGEDKVTLIEYISVRPCRVH